MSKVAISGNASGTGVFTLAAPNSNIDRVLTLPDEAGTIATVNGITSVTLFRASADVSADADPITSWEKPSGQQFGSEVTVSSGVFTFPVTGFYAVRLIGQMILVPDDNASVAIYLSTDGGSSFSIVARSYASGDGSSSSDIAVPCDCFINVTNTSNIKVKTVLASLNSGGYLVGGNGMNETTLMFTRLGDAQ